MNEKKRRKQRQKPKSNEAKNACARIGGKITEVEMLDGSAPHNKRAPLTLDEDGNTIEVAEEQKSEIHPDFRTLAKAVLGQIFKPQTHRQEE